MKTYTDKDFVDVVDEAGEPAGSVPKAWVGTDLLPAGVKPAKGSRQAKPKDDDNGDGAATDSDKTGS